MGATIFLFTCVAIISNVQSMSLQRYQPNRPELVAVQEGVTYDSPGIIALAKLWADRGSSQGAKWQEDASRWYRESLASWLGTKFASRHTRESYRATLLHFFDFVTRLHARISQSSPLTHPILAPHEVRESDVEAYAEFLRIGGTFVQPEMERDKTDQSLVIAITRGKASLGRPVSIEEVLLFYRRVEGAPVADDPSLYKRLRDLARKNAIDSIPRWRDPFWPDPETGILRPPHPFEKIPPTWFKYLPIANAGKIPSPATIAQRLSAVSSFFQHLLAEKPGLLGMRSPVVGNPVADQLKKASSRAKQQRPSRTNARKTTSSDLHLLVRLISDSGQPQLIAARDRFVVTLLHGMGLRVSELCGAINNDVVFEQDDSGHNIHVLTVTGKGEKVRRLAMPARAQAAWEDYRYAILRSQKTDAWKVRATLADAPLVGAVARKGFTLIVRPDKASMEPGSIREIFRRYIALALVGVRALFAGTKLEDRSQAAVRDAVAAWIGTEYAAYARMADAERNEKIRVALTLRLHPHGLRHLFTEQGLASGIPIHVMSALLGHENVGTTMVYAPQQRTEHIRLDAIADYLMPMTTSIVPGGAPPPPGSPPPPAAPARPVPPAAPAAAAAAAVAAAAPARPAAAAPAAAAPTPPARPAAPPPTPPARPAAAAPTPPARPATPTAGGALERRRRIVSGGSNTPNASILTERDTIKIEGPEKPLDVEKSQALVSKLVAQVNSVGVHSEEGKTFNAIALNIQAQIDALHEKEAQKAPGITAHTTGHGRADSEEAFNQKLKDAAGFFPKSPMYAYEYPPIITRDDVPNAIGSFQKTRKGDLLASRNMLLGRSTLLPYFAVIRSKPIDPETGLKAKINIVPLPCVSESVDVDTSSWQVSVSEAFTGLLEAGEVDRARALVKWTGFMMLQASSLSLIARPAGREWINFDGEATPPKQEEAWLTWQQRVRTSTLRVHDFYAGILPWLMEQGTWTARFDPTVDPSEYMVEVTAEAASMGVMEAAVEPELGEKKVKQARLSRIGRWAFVPPMWMVMTEDPLGDLNYGIPIDRRPDFAKWSSRILRNSRRRGKAKAEPESQIYNPQFDDKLASDKRDMDSPRTPGAAVRMILIQLHTALREIDALKQDTRHKAKEEGERNETIRSLFTSLGNRVWGSGWPMAGKVAFRRHVKGGVELTKLNYPDLKVVREEIRASVFALAGLKDPMAGKRLIDVMVEIQGEDFGLFQGLHMNIAANTLVYQADPRTGLVDEKHRVDFFKRVGVDPLVAARRVLRWMWERREYMEKQKASSTTSMDTSQSIVKMANVYMSWVMPTSVQDIKLWAADTLRSLHPEQPPFVTIGYDTIKEAFEAAARSETSRERATAEAMEDLESEARDYGTSQGQVMDVFDEFYPDRRYTPPDLPVLDAWEPASGPEPEGPEKMKKNKRGPASFQELLEHAESGDSGYARKQWSILDDVYINPVAWMCAILS